MQNNKVKLAEIINVNEDARANLLQAREAIEKQIKQVRDTLENSTKMLLEAAQGVKQVVIVSNTCYLVDPEDDAVEVLPMTKKTLLG
jgi:hypothetical protein